MRNSLKRAIFPFLLLLLLPALAQAHPQNGYNHGLSSGFMHPLTGLDHICAMIAVGLLAAQRGGRALWLMPLAFISVMTLGGILGMAKVVIPFVETGIIASVLILGVLIAAAVRLPLTASVLLVGLFALFHGHAHGSEMPATALGISYGLGFVFSTFLLHISGIAIGLTAKQIGSPNSIRLTGGLIALCGVYLFLIVQ